LPTATRNLDHDVNRLTRQLAGFAVPGRASADVLRPSDAAWRGLLRSIGEQQLSGLAIAAAMAGTFIVSSEQHVQLVSCHRDAMAWALELERTLLVVRALLDEAGVSFLVLKGPALAHGPYPDPSWRPFRDLDLLVSGRDWRRAANVLEAAGFHRGRPEPRTGFDERFGKAAVFASASGVLIDLHHRLVLGPFGLWLNAEELFDSAVGFTLGDASLRKLDDTSQFIHTCIHAALGWKPPLLLSIRDVAQVAGSGTVDADELFRRAVRWRVSEVIKYAVDATSKTLEVSRPACVEPVLAAPTDRRAVRAVASYVTDRRMRSGTARSTLLAIPKARDKARYVVDMLFPTRDFLRARGREGEADTYRGRWRVMSTWARSRSRADGSAYRKARKRLSSIGGPQPSVRRRGGKDA